MYKRQAPGAAQSVWNVKSTGNTTADSETTAKTISDGKTVEMSAGKNLTVKQTSNNDGAKVEFDLANDIKIGNDGKDGKDGVDGKIGVNGKDGSSVVINGKAVSYTHLDVYKRQVLHLFLMLTMVLK